MQKFRPSVRPPAPSWPLTVRGCASRWSDDNQPIDNDLIRKARGNFAAVRALEFQQHYAQGQASEAPEAVLISLENRRRRLRSAAAAKPPSGSP